MKRFLLLVGCLTLVGCAGKQEEVAPSIVFEELPPRTEVTLAMYPVGNLGSVSAFSSIVSAYNSSQDSVKVNVEYLTYTDGDDVVESNLTGGTPFDMVFEGPERLVANWGRRELMVPLDDLWEEYSTGVSVAVDNACKDGDTYYEYPVCLTAHCMAVNKDRLEEVGALEFIDDTTRTWSTDDFLKTVELLSESGDVVSVYCASQGGDQGTRMLVNNMYGGTYTNPEHSEYTVNSQENVKALSVLRDASGVVFNHEEDGALAISKFCSGDYAMSLCWNVGQEISHAAIGDVNFDIYPVCYPTEDGSPALLNSGIWGFGVFNTGEKEVAACKDFIRYIVHNKDVYRKVVTLSTFWPVFELEDIYANDAVMEEYGLFTDYVGDYYQVTDNWTEARSAWWQMLQRVGSGENIDASVAWFQQEVEK